jgi:hypothetical protein
VRLSRKALIVLGVLFALVICEYNLSSQIEVSIQGPFQKKTSLFMSRREAVCLERFFRELIICNPFAYTMAESKPLSFASYKKPFTSLSSLFPSNMRIIKGWRVWKKFEPHFVHSKMLFWEEENFTWIIKNHVLIVLADRNRCNEIAHTADFEKILKTNDLFHDIEKVPLFENTLQKNDILIGALLGFGINNARLFSEQAKNLSQLDKKQQLECPKLPGIWGNELMERAARKKYFKSLTFQKFNMDDMVLPGFVGDPDSQESKTLMSEYVTTRRKILEFYEGKHFLEASLSLYMYGRALFDISKTKNSSELAD